MGGRGGGSSIASKAAAPSATPQPMPAPAAPALAPKPTAPASTLSPGTTMAEVEAQLLRLRSTVEGHDLIKDLKVAQLKELATRIGLKPGSMSKTELRKEIIFQTITAPGNFHRALHDDLSTFRR